MHCKETLFQVQKYILVHLQECFYFNISLMCFFVIICEIYLLFLSENCFYTIFLFELMLTNKTFV